MIRKREPEKDTTAIFNKRFDGYERNNGVLWKRYADLGILQEVDTSGPTEETRAELARKFRWGQ